MENKVILYTIVSCWTALIALILTATYTLNYPSLAKDNVMLIPFMVISFNAFLSVVIMAVTLVKSKANERA